MPCPSIESRRHRADIEPLIHAVEHLTLADMVVQAEELFRNEGLHDHLYRWAHWRELIRIYYSFLDRLDGSALRADLLNNLGIVHRDLQEFDRARAC